MDKLVHKSVSRMSYRIFESRQRTLATGQKYDAGYLTGAAGLQLLLDATYIQIVQFSRNIVPVQMYLITSLTNVRLYIPLDTKQVLSEMFFLANLLAQYRRN